MDIDVQKIIFIYIITIFWTFAQLNIIYYLYLILVHDNLTRQEDELSDCYDNV